MWWSGWSTRATDVPVAIVHRDGSNAVSVNQQQNAGKWNSLGQFYFNGAGSVTITAVSGSTVSTCADAVQFVYVGDGVNQPPVAANDSANTTEGSPVTVNVISNDTDDVGINAGSVTIMAPPTNGTAVPDGSGMVTYTPNFGFTGTDTFTYTVTDTQGAVSNTVTVTVTVHWVFLEVVIDNGGPGTSFTGTWGVSGGSNPYGANSLFSRDGTKYTWTFTPTASGSYEVSMWWTVWPSRSTNVPVDINHSGGTSGVTIDQQQNGGKWNSLGRYSFAAGQNYTVTVFSQPGPSSTCADAVKFALLSDGGNLPPTARNDSGVTTMNTPIIINVISNDTDDGGIDASSVTIVTSPANGTAVPAGSGTVTYTPKGMFTGTDTFSYTVADTQGAVSNTATVTVTVPAQNQPPFARNDSADTTVGSPVTVNVISNDTDDVGINAGSVTIVTSSANGTAVPAGSGTVTFTPNGMFTGTDTFSYTVADGQGAVSNTAIVTVTVNPPSAVWVFDNGGIGTSFTGDWSISGGSNPYGSNSFWSRDGATYSWSFTPTVSGVFEVSMWWTTWESRSTNAPVDINHSGGTTRVIIDQQRYGGQWNSLGLYSFAGGVRYTVRITSQPGPSSTCADAVKFTDVGQSLSLKTYSTNFDNTESPMSESGNWIQGGDVGLLWTNVATKNGAAVGTQIDGTLYDDSVAALTGSWGRDQSAEAVIYSANQTGGGPSGWDGIPPSYCNHEVELLLRWQILPNTITGYEILFSSRRTTVEGRTPYNCIIRWDGRRELSSYVVLGCVGGDGAGVTNGDVVKAYIVGNTIIVYKNGVLVNSATDDTYTSGSPGVGFFTSAGCGPTGDHNDDFGFTSFTATIW